MISYGASNGIQVVNYHDALCQCVGYSTGYLFDSVIVDAYDDVQINGVYSSYLSPTHIAIDLGLVPNAAGYALMTQLAQTAIANLTATLKAGYLQNLELGSADVTIARTNFNSVSSGERIQFTPYGIYSDGSTHQQLNENFAGATGTWTSSNPSIMFVSPTGMAWALNTGTATIRYTPANGVKFSSWVMYVSCGPFGPTC